MPQPEELTVLVVDDEPDIRTYFQSVLEDEGFRVITAADGFEALEQVQQQIPDYIILDLVMPKKSGIKFFHELRKEQKWTKIPVMIVTAHAHDEFGKKDFSNIMEGTIVSAPELYLEKPVNPKMLVNAVKKKLGIPVDELPAEETGADELKQEVTSMLKGADVAKLQEALKVLKKR